MKANEVLEHFDFMIEMIFIKIACGGTSKFIQWRVIGTCPSAPNAYIMLIEQIFMLIVAPPPYNIFLNSLVLNSAYQTDNFVFTAFYSKIRF